MRILLAMLAVFVFSGRASGRIGETFEQSVKRYGHGITASRDDKGYVTYYWVKQGVVILASFDKTTRKCEAIEFRKRQGFFTEKQAAVVVGHNKGGNHETNKKMSIPVWWVRGSGCAYDSGDVIYVFDSFNPRVVTIVTHAYNSKIVDKEISGEVKREARKVQDVDDL
jgi:hypothetical protein